MGKEIGVGVAVDTQDMLPDSEDERAQANIDRAVTLLTSKVIQKSDLCLNREQLDIGFEFFDSQFASMNEDERRLMLRWSGFDGEDPSTKEKLEAEYGKKKKSADRRVHGIIMNLRHPSRLGNFKEVIGLSD